MLVPYLALSIKRGGAAARAAEIRERWSTLLVRVYAN